jgi:hypothetical protein
LPIVILLTKSHHTTLIARHNKRLRRRWPQDQPYFRDLRRFIMPASRLHHACITPANSGRAAAGWLATETG